jgi:hypothetical protein
LLSGVEKMITIIDALSVRVEQLERANRRLRLFGAGVVLTSGILVSLGFAGKAQPRIVEAEKIIIRDAQGRPRITIGTPAFAGAAVDTKADSPVIWLSDEHGSDRAMLTEDGLYLADNHAKRLVELRSGPNTPGLRFYGPDGRVAWSAR